MTAEPLPPAEAEARGRWALGLLVVLAFLTAAGLLTYRLGDREFWLDEQITVGHIASAQTLFDAFHPPGYYFLLRQWAAQFGSSDGALRAFSVVCALLGLGMVWLIAREVVPGWAAALTLWLCVLSPFLLLYLRMARYFALVMAVALAATWFILRARAAGKPVYYIGLSLSAAALLWLHHVPSLLLPLGYLWILPVAWRRGRERLWWLAAAAVPIVAYAPCLARTLHGVRAVETASAAGGASLRAVALKLAFPFYSALVGETTDCWRFAIVVPVALAGVALWIAGCVAVWRDRRAARWPVLILWPLTVALNTLLLSTVARSEPWPRVTSLCLFAAPFFYLAIARGAVSRAGSPAPRDSAGEVACATRRSVLAMGLVGVFLLGEVYGTANYLARRQFLNPGYNVPWRAVNRLVQTRGRADDLAIAVLDSTILRYWAGPVAFYQPMTDVAALDAPAETAIEQALRGGNSVWVICRDRGSDEAKTASAKLLDHLTKTTVAHEVYRLGERTETERRWRSRIEGAPAADAYLTIYRFRGVGAASLGAAHG